jgi:hypothetical protein
VPADLDTTRVEWARAYRDLEEIASDPAEDGRMRVQLEVLMSELRKRIGGNFTLHELADEYGGADLWAREVLAEVGAPGWARTHTLVEGAAFHLYARGAVDYSP